MSAVTTWELLPRLTTADVAGLQLDDWGVPDETTGYGISAGDPASRGRMLWLGADRRLASGLWARSPGTVGGTFLSNEIDVLPAGRMAVREDGGTSSEVGAGEHAMWPQGWTGDREVHESVRKAFVMWSPEPLPLPG